MKFSLNHRCAIWILVAAALPLCGASAYGQVEGDITDPNLTEAERRDTTLLWLDTFLTESGLLRKEDMAKIRAAVSQMSGTQLDQWLEETEPLREFVRSDRWQETKQWLREFLRVQAVYSEEELEELRDDLVQADPSEMLAVLKQIQARHDTLVWMQQAVERNRGVAVAERDAYMAQQATAAKAERASKPRNLPLFGAGLNQGAGQKPSTGYQVPRSIINSREMARAAVWSDIWGPGFVIGF
ncbi:MAG: hypothetical protein ACQESR_04145 [Planctomycetota bacterium]